MRYGGSPQSQIRLWFSFFVDYLERRAPRLDAWSFWIGLIFGAVAIAVTYLHHSLPNDSLTEDCIADIASSITTVHRWVQLPLADLMTYAAGPLFALGVILWLARYVAHRGGTKSP